MSAIKEAQQYMGQKGIDCWLIYDYRDSNPTLARVLGEMKGMTRPSFYLIPAEGQPIFIAHYVDAGRVDKPGVDLEVFHGRDEMLEILTSLLSDKSKVAMEYSPRGELPRVSKVDAGTIEMVRGLGCEVVSSGDLAQYVTMRWTPEQSASHKRAAEKVGNIVRQAFDYIGARSGLGVTEYEVAEYVRGRFEEVDLITDSGPIVSVNQHCSDPHYQPASSESAVIGPGDWVLIDLWARETTYYGIYSDITWVAYVGQEVPEQYREVFRIVAGARDLAFQELDNAMRNGQPIEGWQVDRLARDYIEKAGYGHAFGHRLGHSLGAQVHDDGVNLDDLETHDTRTIIPGIGLSIEPGIYLSEFGVRSEIDVYVEEKGLMLTTPIQTEVVCIA